MSLSEWQPIETAPTDGTMVLVSYWNDQHRSRFFGLAYPTHYEEEGEGIRATHWMPLPDAPK